MISFIITTLINQWIGVMIVKRQPDIVNTKSILPVCDKPYYTKKRSTERKKIKVYRNCTFGQALISAAICPTSNSNRTVVSYWCKYTGYSGSTKRPRRLADRRGNVVTISIEEICEENGVHQVYEGTLKSIVTKIWL